MVDKKAQQAQPSSIEVEVHSRYYRPMSSQWLANGVVTVDSAPFYWRAVCQNAKWEVEPSADEGWVLDGRTEEEALELVARALRENRRELNLLDLRKKDMRPVEEGPSVVLAHGGGGTLMQDLINRLIVKHLSNPALDRLEDSASIVKRGRKIMFTTNTYVVSPLFFRGGDIGRLCVCTTVNNLSASGATPVAISLGLVIEEGLPISILEKVVLSVRNAASEAGVMVVAGDVRVVEKGSTDRLFVSTSGLGVATPGIRVGADRARPGDVVLVSGTIGNHGIAVMCEREGLEFKNTVASDVAPLGSLVRALAGSGVSVRCLKDATRGGLAAALNRIATASGVEIEIDHYLIPVRPEVESVCEMLGLDALSVANAGVMVVVCSERTAGRALSAMRRDKYGKNAAIVGRVTEAEGARVVLKTPSGASRILTVPYGEELPRVF